MLLRHIDPMSAIICEQLPGGQNRKLIMDVHPI